MVTTKDIADRVQLSVSTVGRALADDPRISEQTKVRVRQAASELGYVGNRAARMMRGASSNVVGLVIPDIRNSFYITVAHELSTIMAAQDYQLLLAETNDDRLIERRHLRELSASRAAGVVIAPTARPHEESVTLLRESPTSSCCASTRRWARSGSVWTTIARCATPPRICSTWAHQDRLHRRAGRTAHRPAAAARATPRRCGRPAFPAGQSRGAGAAVLLRARPGGGPPPADASDAAHRVVLGSVPHTVGVLDELLELGVDVPNELSVIGFGDQSAFGWWGPGLTTISLPISDVAASCGLWFVRRLDNPPEKDGGQPYESVSTGSLVLRGSTAPPPASTSKRSA